MSEIRKMALLPANIAEQIQMASSLQPAGAARQTPAERQLSGLDSEMK